MYFESEQHYNECMAAQAEAEAHNAEQEAYYEYLGDLLDNRQFDLYAIEICLDMLNSREFKKSGLTAQEFLSLKKVKLLEPKQTIEIGEMPF